ATSRRRLPSCTSVSDDKSCLIGSGFSKTIVAVWSEKRVSSRGFENGNPLNFRCACYDRSPAQNRSILSNKCPGYSRAIPQDYRVALSSKCNFPVFRSAATQTPPPVMTAYGRFRKTQQVATPGNAVASRKQARQALSR